MTINKEELLTQNKLKELLYYDPSSGIFTWLERPLNMFGHCKNPDRQCNIWNTRYARKESGSIKTPKGSKTSYIKICITLNKKKKLYLAHRLAVLYSEGHWPTDQVDHIDGNGLNNARDNLREVNDKENKKNKPMQSNNTSGCVGVTWFKRDQKWRAFIYVNRKSIHGGYFIDIEDAITKRKTMEIEYGYHNNNGRK